MDYVIRVIKGPDAEATCKLQPGATLIGRSDKAQLRLTSPDISWEHAVVSRSGDEYVLENLSAMGTWIDDTRVTGQLRLRPRDQVRLSQDTLLRFEAADGSDSGLLANRRLLMGLVIVMLVGLVGLVIVKPMMTPQPPEDNWNEAHATLSKWLTAQVKSEKRFIPAGTDALFVEAWRQDQVEDYEKARTLWLRLQLLMETVRRPDGKTPSQLAEENPDALQLLLTPSPIKAPPTDAPQLTAALMQFINRRLAWSNSKVKAPVFGISPQT